MKSFSSLWEHFFHAGLNGKNVTHFLIIYILLFWINSPDAFAFEIPKNNCSERKISDNIVEVRIDKRFFYGFFSAHLMNHSEKVLSIIGDKNSSLENSIKKLKNFLQENLHIVRSEKQDVEKIIKLISQRPDMKWVGIEASKKEMQNGYPIEQQVKDYHYFKNALQTTFKLNPQETDQILHLMYSTYIIAMAKKPDLFRKIRFIPIDDDLEKEKAFLAMKQSMEIRQQIITQAQAIGLPFAVFKNIEDMVDTALRNFQKVTPGQTENQLKVLENEELKSLVNNYFLSVNQFLEAARQRDQTMAYTIIRQPGSGLIIAGTAHGPGVTHTLLALCSLYL